MTSGARPRIGISASFFHADPQRNLFKGKTLLFAEETMLQWVMSEGLLPVLVPRGFGPLPARVLVEELDGLILTGGADLSPKNYGEDPLRPEWAGDHVRDHYELELTRACLELNRPLLGICRGAQLLNVALGGTLWQDIETLHPGRRLHRNWELYDQHAHEVNLLPGSWLARTYGHPAGQAAWVNSVHHQGLRELGRGLAVEARAPDDVIEAVRYDVQDPQGQVPFALGVQWHPEFLFGTPIAADALDPRTLLRAYVTEVDERKRHRADIVIPRSA